MAAFERLMRRLGFVKLGDYGLVLTPDDRIQSTRPHVLEDTLGAPIVGWLESDLAVAELPRFGAPKEPSRKIEPPASLIASLSSPALPKYVERPPVAAAPIRLPTDEVEDAEPENEWEWEAALARARAAAEQAEAAARTFAPAPAPAPQPVVASQAVPFRRAQPVIAPQQRAASPSPTTSALAPKPSTTAPTSPGLPRAVLGGARPMLRPVTPLPAEPETAKSAGPTRPLGKLKVVRDVGTQPGKLSTKAPRARKTAPMTSAVAPSEPGRTQRARTARPGSSPGASEDAVRTKTAPMAVATAPATVTTPTARHRLARGTDPITPPAEKPAAVLLQPAPVAPAPPTAPAPMKPASITSLPSIKQRMISKS
jgi:hypothetical protein